VLDQHRDHVLVVRPAIDVVAVDDVEQLGARDAVRPISDGIDDALAHRSMHDQRRLKWAPT
jgi:hypothetical protein